MGRELFLKEVESWLGPLSRIQTAEFEITAIEELQSAPLAVRAQLRYSIVGTRGLGEREERGGIWQTEWSRSENGAWRARKWEARDETLAIAIGPAFMDCNG